MDCLLLLRSTMGSHGGGLCLQEPLPNLLKASLHSQAEPLKEPGTIKPRDKKECSLPHPHPLALASPSLRASNSILCSSVTPRCTWMSKSQRTPWPWSHCKPGDPEPALAFPCIRLHFPNPRKVPQLFPIPENQPHQWYGISTLKSTSSHALWQEGSQPYREVRLSSYC